MLDRRVVVDTSVFISAMIGPKGPGRELLRRCFEAQLQPIMGNALFCEYESVIARPKILAKCPLSAQEILTVFNSFMSICTWVPVYFLWRPNLIDEADNHLIDLAVSGQAEWIVTNNTKHFRGMELVFKELRICRPEDILKEI
jgi:putative PIN family toxin of toxin-antitoxin system